MNVHGKDIKIFSCNANRAFAEQIARKLGLPLGDMQVKTFSDGEIALSINESVRGSDVFVVQSTCQPVNNNLMELLIAIDAFKRASAGRITAVMPYFGYARQDRKAKARDPISAKLVADLLTAAGADRVLTMDLHAAQIQGFFNIPVDHLLGVPVLANYYIDKFKDMPTANVSEVMNIIGDVKDKTCVIVDDMVDTAGTLCNAANALITKGGAKAVYAGATHGVLSGPALDRIEESVLSEMILLDTIPLTHNTASNKLKQLSVAPVFAEAIHRIYSDRSVSPLLD